MGLTKEFREKLVTFYNKRHPHKEFALLNDKTYLMATGLKISSDGERLIMTLKNDQLDLSENIVSNIPDFKNGEILEIHNLIILQEFAFKTDPFIEYEK